MDFVADRMKRRRLPEREAERLYETYQMLGRAWEFIGLRCDHGAGYRRFRDGTKGCRICGKVPGSPETHLLLPVKGPKTIGRLVRPAGRRVFPNRRKALLLDDAIRFHGADLRVEVHHAYRRRSRLSKTPVTIAEERSVRLRERGLECWIDRRLIHIDLYGGRGKKRPKRYGAMPFELPRRLARKFPVIFRYDERDRLVALTILT
jgi:hypothetical protein